MVNGKPYIASGSGSGSVGNAMLYPVPRREALMVHTQRGHRVTARGPAQDIDDIDPLGRPHKRLTGKPPKMGSSFFDLGDVSPCSGRKKSG